MNQASKRRIKTVYFSAENLRAGILGFILSTFTELILTVTNHLYSSKERTESYTACPV